MPKPTYERRVLQISPSQVVMLHSGHGKKGLIREYRDTKSVGLTLRILERQAVWYLRRRDMTLRLGRSTDFELWKARYIADHPQKPSPNCVAATDAQTDLARPVYTTRRAL